MYVSDLKCSSEEPSLKCLPVSCNARSCVCAASKHACMAETARWKPSWADSDGEILYIGSRRTRTGVFCIFVFLLIERDQF